MIFLDDFIGSGDTFLESFRKIKFSRTNFGNIYYGTLISIKKGVTKVENQEDVNVVSALTYDESNMVLEGLIFTKEEISEIKKMISYYESRMSGKFFVRI